MALVNGEVAEVMYPVAAATPTPFSGYDRVLGVWFADTAGECLDGRDVAWFLMGRLTAHDAVRMIAIHVSPFRIGRDWGMDLSLPFPTVSRVHAEILTDGGHLEIRDLASRNGTFVDGRRLQTSLILEMDALVHFANVPFHIVRITPGRGSPSALE